MHIQHSLSFQFFERRFAIVPILISTLLTMALAAASPPKTQNLLRRAVKVPTLKDWGIPDDSSVNPPGHWYPYHWLSPHEVLIFRVVTKPDDPLEITKCTLVSHNIRTGKDRILTALTKQFKETNGAIGSLQVSPNGKWITWVGCSFIFDLFDCNYIASTDGLHCFSAKVASSREEVLWSRDSRYWAAIVFNYDNRTKIILHRTEHPEVTQEYPIVPDSPLNTVNQLAIDKANFTSERCLQAYTYDAESPGTDVITMDMTTGSVQTCRRTFLPPKGASMGFFAFSPQSERVAWFTNFQGKDYITSDLWTSFQDGTRLHEIGTVNVPTDTKHSADGPHSLRWLPDGKHLSFIYKQELYTVPTD